MRVKVEGVGASCAHFIEIGGEFERLHGHNLVFSAEAESAGEGGLVMDFRDLHALLSEVTSKLDHRLLIPQENEELSVVRDGDYLDLDASGKRYRIPVDDATLLPICNSTAEEIAGHVFREMGRAMPAGVKLRYVAVEEIEGSRAFYDGG